MVSRSVVLGLIRDYLERDSEYYSVAKHLRKGVDQSGKPSENLEGILEKYFLKNNTEERPSRSISESSISGSSESESSEGENQESDSTESESSDSGSSGSESSDSSDSESSSSGSSDSKSSGSENSSSENSSSESSDNESPSSESPNSKSSSSESSDSGSTDSESSDSESSDSESSDSESSESSERSLRNVSNNYSEATPVSASSKRKASGEDSDNKRQKQDSLSSFTESISPSPPPENSTDFLAPGQKKHFSRVDPTKVAFAHHTLTDNSYKGAAGNWGEKANERLISVRGKDFTKNKNKLKKGSYKGGSISLSSGSFKFED